MTVSKTSGDKPRLLQELTPHETKILNLVANGYTNSAVAGAMLIDIDAVRHHIDIMYRKVARIQSS